MSQGNSRTLGKELLVRALWESVLKLNPRVLVRNPVMFVVELGFIITLVLSIDPGVFGGNGSEKERLYNIIVALLLIITVIFGNFAEAIAEGRGKAQAESLRRTKSDLMANKQTSLGSFTQIPASTLRKGDMIRVIAGELIPSDGDVTHGLWHFDESAITG